MCVIQKREKYLPDVTIIVASMVLEMANPSSIKLNIRPPSPRLRPKILRPSDFEKEKYGSRTKKVKTFLVKML